MNFNMPTHLNGDMATLWNNLKTQAGATPEAAVKVTDQTQFAGVTALSSVGGCTFVKAEDGLSMDVSLLFAAEESAEVEPEITAVAKPHKFAR